ncbi:MAG: histidinol dehydrogenase [Candidatus Hydrogenedentes bacterium]|nr:histidinol dehydrogenase [Candidatus Hydrogenedentota bacterium]
MRIIEVTDDATYRQAVEALSGPVGDETSERSFLEKVEATRSIVEDVRKRGDAAVAEFTARFDGAQLRPDQFELSRKEIDKAVETVDQSLVATLARAHDNIRKFHAKNLRQSWEEVDEDGTKLGQRITPIESAGVYVPGGKAFYPSTVLMNIVPARVAGVGEIVMVSPPSYEGSIHPLVLAAARMAGATRVFRVGGAQAIAALAYGTEHIPAVLKITGPGNQYVAAAKRLISPVCDIDKEAGPSEVIVLADAKANPRLVAIEMLAQAEHDETARPILISTSAELIQRVLTELENETRTLSRADIIRGSLDGQGLIILARSQAEAVELIDIAAPEHLSVQVEYPNKVLDKIHNVGCAVLGGATSVAVGDYYAGPNHILPTGRRARVASPLTAEDFRKVTSIISYSPERMRRSADDIARLARAEELTAHARAVELRK